MGCNQSADSVAVTKPSSRPNFDSIGVESQDEGRLTPNSTSYHQHSTGTEVRDLLPGATDSESHSPNSEDAKGRRRNRRRPSQESNRNNYLLSLEDDNHNNSDDDSELMYPPYVPSPGGNPLDFGNDDRDRPPAIPAIFPSTTPTTAPMPMFVETMSSEDHEYPLPPPTSVIRPSNRKVEAQSRPAPMVGVGDVSTVSCWRMKSQAGFSMKEPERAEWWIEHIGEFEAQDFPYDKEEIAAHFQPPGKSLVTRIQDWGTSYHQHSTGTETRDLLPGATDSESRSPTSEDAKGRRRNRRRPSQESNRDVEDSDDGSQSELMYPPYDLPSPVGNPLDFGNDDRDRPPAISAIFPLTTTTTAPMPMCVIVETMSSEEHEYPLPPPTSVIMPANRKVEAQSRPPPMVGVGDVANNNSFVAEHSIHSRASSYLVRPGATLDKQQTTILDVARLNASSSCISTVSCWRMKSQAGFSMKEPERAEWWIEHIGELEAQDFPYDKKEIAAHFQPPRKSLVKRIQDWTSSTDPRGKKT